MRILVTYNMHTNETWATKPVVEKLNSMGYTVERLAGYHKEPSIDQSGKFKASMERVKARGEGFDMIVDLHGVIFPARRLVGGRLLRDPWDPLTSFMFVAYDRRLKGRLAELVSELLGQKRLIARLLGWSRRVKVVFDEFSAPIVQSVGLGGKYIEVEIFDVMDAGKVFPEVLKRLGEGLALEGIEHRDQGSLSPPSP
ncbi:MAG: hypothetical protein ACE5Z5_14965 [Candidatus Bathyarchaeia archaeon]